MAPTECFKEKGHLHDAPMPHNHHPRLNSCKLDMDEEREQLHTWALRTFGPSLVAVFGGTLTLFSALYMTGFLQAPATKSSVEDLKTTIQAYIARHDELDAARGAERNARQQNIQTEIGDIKTSLNQLLERSREQEIRQSRMEGLLSSPALPAPTPPSGLPSPKRAPHPPVYRTKPSP